ncbi:MAG: OsmC family protein [Ignavibacteria bacterium]|nr:OsmC family protein [Ignavibacteria bacterium]
MITSTLKYLGDLRMEAIHLQSGTVINTDAPVDNQGKGEAFSPTDLMATSLGLCMITIMGIAARTHGFSIDGTNAEVTKIMGSDPRRVAEIVVNIYFPKNDYSDKQKHILQVCADTCPVSHSLSKDLKQNVKLIF